MSLLSWNVQGLGFSRTFTEVQRVLCACNPNMVFLMETKLTRSKEKTTGESGFS